MNTSFIFYEFDEQNEEFIEVDNRGSFFFSKHTFLRALRLIGIQNFATKIYVVFINHEKDLSSNSFLNRFAVHFGDPKKLGPCIILGDLNLSNKKNEGNNTDARQLFLDSSIWTYYINFLDKKLESTDIQNILRSVLQSINSNAEKGLYNAIVAQEFFELQCRLLLNSYLKIKGGHASSIRPFTFHSELVFKEKAKKMPAELISYEGFSWDILVLDDYSTQPLTKVNSLASSELVMANKTDIIKELLKECFPSKKIETIEYQNNNDLEQQLELEKFESDRIVLHCCSKLETAKCVMRKKGFDLILLDYLLDEKDSKPEQRNYGLSLIQSIIQNIGENGKLKNGPLGAHWIMPISVFHNAFLNNLQEEGIPQFKNICYISRGADPINTPELFKYNLLQFIDYQVSLSYFDCEKIWCFIRHKLDNNDFENGCETVRTWATQIVGPFMFEFGRISILEQNALEGSYFAKSIILRIEGDASDLFFHVRELLDFLAYGTAFDSDLGWEEFQYLKDYWAEEIGNGKLIQKFDTIGDYIIELKQNIII